MDTGIVLLTLVYVVIVYVRSLVLLRVDDRRIFRCLVWVLDAVCCLLRSLVEKRKLEGKIAMCITVWMLCLLQMFVRCTIETVREWKSMVCVLVRQFIMVWSLRERRRMVYEISRFAMFVLSAAFGPVVWEWGPWWQFRRGTFFGGKVAARVDRLGFRRFCQEESLSLVVQVAQTVIFPIFENIKNAKYKYKIHINIYLRIKNTNQNLSTNKFE